jgi:hypothetical protein
VAANKKLHRRLSRPRESSATLKDQRRRALASGGALIRAAHWMKTKRGERTMPSSHPLPSSPHDGGGAAPWLVLDRARGVERTSPSDGEGRRGWGDTHEMSDLSFLSLPEKTRAILSPSPRTGGLQAISGGDSRAWGRRFSHGLERDHCVWQDLGRRGDACSKILAPRGGFRLTKTKLRGDRRLGARSLLDNRIQAALRHASQFRRIFLRYADPNDIDFARIHERATRRERYEPASRPAAGGMP